MATKRDTFSVSFCFDDSGGELASVFLPRARVLGMQHRCFLGYINTSRTILARGGGTFWLVCLVFFDAERGG